MMRTRKTDLYGSISTFGLKKTALIMPDLVREATRPGLVAAAFAAVASRLLVGVFAEVALILSGVSSLVAALCATLCCAKPLQHTMQRLLDSGTEHLRFAMCTPTAHAHVCCKLFFQASATHRTNHVT